MEEQTMKTYDRTKYVTRKGEELLLAHARSLVTLINKPDITFPRTIVGVFGMPNFNFYNHLESYEDVTSRIKFIMLFLGVRELVDERGNIFKIGDEQ